MITAATIRHIITKWTNWRSRKVIRQAYPDIEELDQRQCEATRSHRKGAARFIAEKRAAMTGHLRDEMRLQ